MSGELPERQAILLDDDFLKNIVEENMETKWEEDKLYKFLFPSHCTSYSYLFTLSSLSSISILLPAILREFPR